MLELITCSQRFSFRQHKLYTKTVFLLAVRDNRRIYIHCINYFAWSKVVSRDI